MPAFHIEMIRQDPGSAAYEVTKVDLTATTMTEALWTAREAADVSGKTDWKVTSLEARLLEDVIVAGEEPPPKRSWLCRLLCG